MKLLVRTLTVVALAAVAAIPAASAPPSMAGARVTYGKPAVAWTLTPGSTADLIQFTRSLPANPNAFWPRADEQSPLSPKQTSWRAGERFAPAVMTYFGVRGGRITNVKLGRVVFAKYDPFFGRIL